MIVGQGADHSGRIIAVCIVCGETSDHFQFCLEAVVDGLERDAHPEYIVSDADDSIGLAIEAVLPDVNHVMCWFHMGTKAAWCTSRSSKALKALNADEKVTLIIYIHLSLIIFYYSNVCDGSSKDCTHALTWIYLMSYGPQPKRYYSTSAASKWRPT